MDETGLSSGDNVLSNDDGHCFDVYTENGVVSKRDRYGTEQSNSSLRPLLDESWPGSRARPA